jgi:hypothetical protein
MKETSTALVTLGHVLGAEPASPPSLETQHLWFRVAQARPARLLVVVPADPGLSTVPIARELARVAAGQVGHRVLLVIASIDACADEPQQRVPDLSIESLRAGVGEGLAYDVVDFSSLPRADGERALASALQLPEYIEFMDPRGMPYSKAIFATDSPLSRAQTIPLLRGADGVIVCARLGSTSLANVRRITDMIGRDRILGSIAVRPASSSPAARRTREVLDER